MENLFFVQWWLGLLPDQLHQEIIFNVFESFNHVCNVN